MSAKEGTTADLPECTSELVELEQAAVDGVYPGWLVACTASMSLALMSRDIEQIGELRELLARVDRHLAVAHGETLASPGRAALDSLGTLLRHSHEHLQRSAFQVKPHSRVARMLCVIAAEPGAGNERIAAQTGMDAAAVTSIGRRLQQLGLGQPSGYGRSDAWRLTPFGAEVASRLPSGREAVGRAFSS